MSILKAIIQLDYKCRARHTACAKSLQLCLTLCDPWSVAHQTPLFMGFSKQEYWSGLPCAPPGDLPNPQIEPVMLISTRIGTLLLAPKAHCGHTIFA